jgi:hypothetical protein
MTGEQFPMVRLVRKAGRIQEITLGASLGTTIIRMIIVATAIALLPTRVVTWSDFVSLLRSLGW